MCQTGSEIIRQQLRALIGASFEHESQRGFEVELAWWSVSVHARPVRHLGA